MKKMFLKVLLLCLCLWRLTGVTGETPVHEGGSITLRTYISKVKDDDVIQWRFGTEKILIAEINKQNDSFTVFDNVLDGRFRDRLKLDEKTGSLIISNATIENTGRYDLQINKGGVSFNLAIIFSVNEGDSVTLNSDFTDIKDDDVIQWKFRNTEIENNVITEKHKQNVSIIVYDDVLDGRFRDRLKLNKQTGSLTITNTTNKHTGRYELQINSVKMYFFLTVIVPISVNEGDSVTLNTGITDIKEYDLIWWRFGAESIVIADTNKQAKRTTLFDDVLDGRFRDRLKMDKNTGSLTITNITMKHAGDYKLLMMYDGLYKLEMFHYRYSPKTFRVSVHDSVNCCGAPEAVI